MKTEEVLKYSQESFNSLSSNDVSQVAKAWLAELESHVRSNPVQALLVGATIGAGLTALRGEHLRIASYRFAKILALKALAGFEPRKDQAHEIA